MATNNTPKTPRATTAKKTSPRTPKPTLNIQRVYTTPGIHPYDQIEWEPRDITQTNWKTGETVFEQKNVLFPTSWSLNAATIVTTKYFRGAINTPERETSLKQLIDRVVNTYTKAAHDHGYITNPEDLEIFDHELKHMLVNQIFSFNSPVWFNVGTTSPQQVSACQPYHSLVNTVDGLIPIGEIVEKNMVGLKVHNADGSLAQILAVKNNGVKEVLEITTKSGHRLEVTADHLVWKATGGDSGRFVQAGTLMPGDQLSWSRSIAASGGAIADDVAKMTRGEQAAALAGWLMTDAFVGQYSEGTNRSLTVEPHAINHEEYEWVTKLVKAEWGNVHSHERQTETSAEDVDFRRIRLYGEPLRDFVERWHLMRRGASMEHPSYLDSAPLGEVVAYLRSVYQADGYVSLRPKTNSAYIGLSMESESVMRGVHRLLGRLGVFSRISSHEDSRGDRNTRWLVGIQSLGDRRRFADTVGFISKDKSDKLHASLHYDGRQSNRSKTLTIASIATVGEQTVYDIQTDTEEYLSNGIRVHNCFILAVDDTMDSILNWYREEGLIFKGGSGAGLNLSKIRGSKELLRSSGGTASGPVSFMRGADASAGTIKSGGACLAPWTKVYTTEFGPKPVAELAASGDDFTVLSYNPVLGRVQACRARAWESGRKQLMKLITDKGEFTFSKDHPILLMDGRYVAVEELKPGMSIRPLTIVVNKKGYQRIAVRAGEKESVHRLVAQDVLGSDISKMEVHHKDRNPGNNGPDNLEVHSRAEHLRVHALEDFAAGTHPLQKYHGPGNHPQVSGDNNGMSFASGNRTEEYQQNRDDGMRRAGVYELGAAAAQHQKMLNTAYKVVNAGYSIDTFEDYIAGRKIVIGRIASITRLEQKIIERFGSYEAFLEEVRANNHSVVAIEPLELSVVYDVEVDNDTPRDKSPLDGHNFLTITEVEKRDLTGYSGIFVSNTRRAAKMVVLDVDHPDIEEFVETKAKEEEKIRVLRDAGFDMDLGGTDIVSVQYQNANNSVRVSDEFMTAVEQDSDFGLRARTTGEVISLVNAKKLFRKIAEAAWACADPGVQYDDTINHWHTNTETGRITASNPCFAGETLVAVADGRNAVRIDQLASEAKDVPVYACDVDGSVHVRTMSRVRLTRVDAEMVRVTLDDGSYLRVTPDHRLRLRNGKMKAACELVEGDQLMPFDSKVAQHGAHLRRKIRGGAPGWEMQQQLVVGRRRGDSIDDQLHVHHLDGDSLNDSPDNLVVLDNREHRRLHASGKHPLVTPGVLQNRENRIAKASKTLYGEGNPNYKHGNHIGEGVTKTRDCPQCGEEFTAIARVWTCSIECRDAWRAENPYETILACSECGDTFVSHNGSGLYCGQACSHAALVRRRNHTKECEKCGQHFDTYMPSVRFCSRSCAGQARWDKAGRLPSVVDCLYCGDSFQQPRKESKYCNSSCAAKHRVQMKKAAPYTHNHRVVSVKPDGRADVYDGEVEGLHNFAVITSVESGKTHREAALSGIFAAQCSEYLSIDDSSCNLASLNLMKFREADGTFDIDLFTQAVEYVITAMEISISFADFPTKAIGANTRDYRQLGIGYANLGALLMANGLPYDSPEGRAYSSAITSLMTGVAYRRSAEIAGVVGPYTGYKKNAEPHTRVMRQHADAATSLLHATKGSEATTFIEKNVVGSYSPAVGIAEASVREWEKGLEIGSRNGWRNAQASVLAPTGCLTADTLVNSNHGIMRLDEMGDIWGDKWQELEGSQVATPDGPQQATKFFVNGEEEALQIESVYGSRISGTYRHQLKVVNSEHPEPVWKHMMDIRDGDWVVSLRETMVGAPRQISLPVMGEPYFATGIMPTAPELVTPELAELVGYFMGDGKTHGSAHSKGLRFCVAAEDADVATRLQSLVSELFGIEATAERDPRGRLVNVVANSTLLVAWWEAAGFFKIRPTATHRGKGYTPHVPARIRATNNPEIWAAFLRGLYEADATASLTLAGAGNPTLSSASRSFVNEISIMLRTMGFATTISTSTPTANRYSDKPSWRIRLRNNTYVRRWYDEVGFISSRKQNFAKVESVRMTGRKDFVVVDQDHARKVAHTTAPEMAQKIANAIQRSQRRYGLAAVPRVLLEELQSYAHDARVADWLSYWFEPVLSITEIGMQPTYDISVPSNVTYVANGLVSHNTIGFMMDVDTTGVEPDFSLVKFKKMVGGGSLQIVNQRAHDALTTLGYDPDAIALIEEYVREHGNVVDAPGLKQEHYPVFDCAVGERAISPMGHIQMMAAVQPFLSGAISKCVTGDSLVATSNGLIRIGSWHEGESPDSFRDHVAEIQSLDGVRKTDAFYYGGLRNVRRVKLGSGHRIVGTGNHRLLSADAAGNGFTWKRLDELQPGDAVAQHYGANLWSTVPAGLSEFTVVSPEHGNQKKVELPKEMSTGLAFFLGAYASEGSISLANWTIRITNPEGQILERVKAVAEELFGLEAKIVESDDRCSNVTIASKTLVEFMLALGCGMKSGEKRIPQAVLASPFGMVVSFLQGLWLDAYVSSGNAAKWAISLKSNNMLDDLQAVLSNMGVVHNRVSNYNAEYERFYDEVYATGEHAKLLLSLVPFLEEHKVAASRAIEWPDGSRDTAHVVPGVRAESLYSLLPATARSEFGFLKDPRTKNVTRRSLERVAAIEGVVLPEWLQTVVEQNLWFSQVESVEDDGMREVFDVSVPETHAFVANGIMNHNTVNLPESATVEEIEQVYYDGWKLGLKAIAVYRDNCKVGQPLSDSKAKPSLEGSTGLDSVEPQIVERIVEKIVERPVRRRLPKTRDAATTSFVVGGAEGYLTTGRYDDGDLGEVFVKMSKQGSTLAGIMDAFSIAVSLGLQYGVPLEAFVSKFVNMRFEPSGMTDDPDVRMAQSLLDYMFRKVALAHMPYDERSVYGIYTTGERAAALNEGSGDVAPNQAEIAPAPKPELAVEVSHSQADTVSTESTPAVETGESADSGRKHFSLSVDAPLCSQCGIAMVRTGACNACPSCGQTSGCS